MSEHIPSNETVINEQWIVNDGEGSGCDLTGDVNMACAFEGQKNYVKLSLVPIFELGTSRVLKMSSRHSTVRLDNRTITICGANCSKTRLEISLHNFT